MSGISIKRTLAPPPGLPIPPGLLTPWNYPRGYPFQRGIPYSFPLMIPQIDPGARGLDGTPVEGEDAAFIRTLMCQQGNKQVKTNNFDDIEKASRALAKEVLRLGGLKCDGEHSFLYNSLVTRMCVTRLPCCSKWTDWEAAKKMREMCIKLHDQALGNGTDVMLPAVWLGCCIALLIIRGVQVDRNDTALIVLLHHDQFARFFTSVKISPSLSPGINMPEIMEMNSVWGSPALNLQTIHLLHPLREDKVTDRRRPTNNQTHPTDNQRRTTYNGKRRHVSEPNHAASPPSKSPRHEEDRDSATNADLAQKFQDLCEESGITAAPLGNEQRLSVSSDSTSSYVQVVHEGEDSD